MQAQQPTTSMPTPSTATNLPTPTTGIPTIPVAPKRTTNDKNGRHQKCVKERKKITEIFKNNSQKTNNEEQTYSHCHWTAFHLFTICRTRKEGQKFHTNVTQYDWDEETIKTVPTDVDVEEDENLQQLPRRSPRLQFNQSINVPAAGISHAALTASMGMESLEEPSHMAWRNLDPVAIEQIANGVVHPVTKETITKYQKLFADPILRDKWKLGMCRELGRLAQGYGGKGSHYYIKGTNTIFFMNIDEIRNISKDQVCTYARIVVDYRPQKKGQKQSQNFSGGNLIDYPGKLTKITADMTTSKLMWNSTISTHNARYMCTDAANFYLATPLDRP